MKGKMILEFEENDSEKIIDVKVEKWRYKTFVFRLVCY